MTSGKVLQNLILEYKFFQFRWRCPILIKKKLLFSSQNQFQNAKIKRKVSPLSEQKVIGKSDDNPNNNINEFLYGKTFPLFFSSHTFFFFKKIKIKLYKTILRKFDRFFYFMFL